MLIETVTTRHKTKSSLSVMKTKISVLIFVIVLVVFLSGCVSTQTVRSGNTVYEGVIVTKKGVLIGASRDNVNVTNVCPSGYYVDFKKGSTILYEGIKPGQTVTIRPNTCFRDDAVAFSSMAYTLGQNGEKIVVSFSDQIITIGSAPITVTWKVGKDGSSINWQHLSTYSYNY